MKKITSKINIGLAIKLELTKQGHSISWLAREIGHDKSNLNKKLERAHLYNEELLMKISNILKVDFFNLYVEVFNKKHK